MGTLYAIRDSCLVLEKTLGLFAIDMYRTCFGVMAIGCFLSRAVKLLRCWLIAAWSVSLSLFARRTSMPISSPYPFWTISLGVFRSSVFSLWTARAGSCATSTRTELLKSLPLIPCIIVSVTLFPYPPFPFHALASSPFLRIGMTCTRIQPFSSRQLLFSTFFTSSLTRLGELLSTMIPSCFSPSTTAMAGCISTTARIPPLCM